MKLSFGKKIAGIAVAGALVAGAGTMAWADSNNGAATASPTSTAPAGGAATPKTPSGKAAERGLALLRRADHGTVEVKVKAATPGIGTPSTGTKDTATWQTVTFDRGQVSGVAADHITLARPDGQSVTLAINAATKYRGVASWQQVKTSQGAIVVSENGVATVILQRAVEATPAAPATSPAPAA